MAEVDEDEETWCELISAVATKRHGRTVIVRPKEAFATAAVGVPARRAHLYLENVEGKNSLFLFVLFVILLDSFPPPTLKKVLAANEGKGNAFFYQGWANLQY